VNSSGLVLGKKLILNHTLAVNLLVYWIDESFDERVTTILEGIIAWGIHTAKSRNILDPWPWPYLNYALPTQSLYDSYGTENVQKLKIIKKYDPSNQFGQIWSGWFKLSFIETISLELISLFNLL